MCFVVSGTEPKALHTNQTILLTEIYTKRFSCSHLRRSKLYQQQTCIVSFCYLHAQKLLSSFLFPPSSSFLYPPRPKINVDSLEYNFLHLSLCLEHWGAASVHTVAYWSAHLENWELLPAPSKMLFLTEPGVGTRGQESRTLSVSWFPLLLGSLG